MEQKKEELEGTLADLKQQLNMLQTQEKQLLQEEKEEEEGIGHEHVALAKNVQPFGEESEESDNELKVIRLREEISEKEFEIENITR